MKNNCCRILLITFLLGISAFLNSCYEAEIQKKKVQDPACTMLPKPGRCKGRIQSFFFNSKKEKCEVFHWGGCGGSRPFQTLDECQTKCLPN